MFICQRLFVSNDNENKSTDTRNDKKKNSTDKNIYAKNAATEKASKMTTSTRG